jgi:hypothetical protein
VNLTPAYSARRSFRRNGTPAKGPVGRQDGRFGAGAVEHRRDDGIELRVETLDPRDRRLDQLDRPD